MKVFLKYGFLFDPEDSWQNREDFDLALGELFLSMGFRAENIRTASEEDDLIMVNLVKIEEPQEAPVAVAPGKKLTNMSKNRGFDGKFKKNG